ncbi:MAG: glycosyltransferase family 2 protein [Candidatus Doudnabacteria bacterium]|nr:glycosyltransferase family 2 protein [Candidatus Doudnabacteria bacterium]
MDLSIIIVNYNTRDLLQRCLRSVFASITNYSYEVIVSDNGSSDGSVDLVKEFFPQVKLLENRSNLGFSKANNLAIKISQGRYVLLLNSDTEVNPNTFQQSMAYLEKHAEVGILGCKVLLPDATLDPACRRRFPTPANAFLRLFGLKRFSDYNVSGDVNREMEVDAVMGAYLLIRRSVIERVGLLDEDFFMYGEDLDWCFRVKTAGYKVVYYPGAKITHFKYGSSQKVPDRTIRFAHQAMEVFYRKHYSSRYPRAFNFLVFLAIKLHGRAVIFLNFFRSRKTVH